MAKTTTTTKAPAKAPSAKTKRAAEVKAAKAAHAEVKAAKAVEPTFAAPRNETERVEVVNTACRIWKQHKADGGTAADQPQYLRDFEAWKLSGGKLAERTRTARGTSTGGVIDEASGIRVKGTPTDELESWALAHLAANPSTTRSGMVKAYRAAGFQCREQRFYPVWERIRSQVPTAAAPAKARTVTTAKADSNPTGRAARRKMVETAKAQQSMTDLGKQHAAAKVKAGPTNVGASVTNLQPRKPKAEGALVRKTVTPRPKATKATAAKGKGKGAA